MKTEICRCSACKAALKDITGRTATCEYCGSVNIIQKEEVSQNIPSSGLSYCFKEAQTREEKIKARKFRREERRKRVIEKRKQELERLLDDMKIPDEKKEFYRKVVDFSVPIMEMAILKTMNKR